MFEMLLGHCVGDYLLQNDWMALGKSKHNRLGLLTCTVHCLLYTLSVCTLMWTFYPTWILIVFFSHFVLDKFGLPEKYLRIVGGRSLGLFLENTENATYTPYIGLRAGFTAFVYVVADNTMHLLIMWGAWKAFFAL